MDNDENTTISSSEYVKYIRRNEIPPYSPTPISWGSGFLTTKDDHDARSECTSRGLWIVIDKHWTGRLADWIGKRKCLEIMAGGGWLAKALNEHNVNIIATDDYSWDNSNHNNMIRVYPVAKMSAINAVRQHPDADILIVSWAPYGNDAICKACNEWGHTRPIIHIGEGDGGCNAPSGFWHCFREREDWPQGFGMQSWYGLHDYINIGVYDQHLYWR